MLKTAGNELFYYAFSKETSNHNYEIVFVCRSIWYHFYKERVLMKDMEVDYS